ncbi:hypothetical protein MGYG_09069 [Nannizzia gypsea CBS 118893]|uniref:Uncharacterized protein n=1 Tax=Arthroderma gypseum (strain ATCC MYA-4604 / CBS 118893) TaxID=535722 RepID=E4UY25_ARTGP|nr:hypothetical protein MGYG_09069 [Nannizzia gypsea CBS 118893]EFR02018.1 hypothetical protein MGYG_09069 [Nannizzia gypsea CBS 118893]
MAYSTPLLYIEQEPWLHILPAEPAIEPCFSIQRAYLPGFEDVVYIIGEHLAEQPIPCRRVIPLSTDQCPICQMLRHRNYTYQYLLPVEVHVRNEFIPVCCGKHIPLIVGDRTASYHSPADGTGATKNITFVQSTINLPKYFILDNEEVDYRRCRHQPRDCPPKRSQREHRRRSRPHHRADELHTQERKRVEFKNLEVHNDTRESRSKSTRTPSPITFSRASKLAESPTPVRTDKATAIPPQAPSGSTKHSPTKSQRPASDTAQNLVSYHHTNSQSRAIRKTHRKAGRE